MKIIRIGNHYVDGVKLLNPTKIVKVVGDRRNSSRDDRPETCAVFFEDETALNLKMSVDEFEKIWADAWGVEVSGSE